MGLLISFKDRVIKLFKIIIGYFTYKSLFKDKKKNYYVTYMGLGDTLIFGGLLYKYKKTYPEEEMRLVVPLKHKKITEGYSKYINELIILTDKKMENLVIFIESRFFIEKANVKSIFSKEGFNFIGIKGINYYNLFEMKLDISFDNKVLKPEFKLGENKLENIIKKYKINKNKSVILSPYARSVEQINSKSWEDISKYLNSKGYKVYTNVKDYGEKAVKDTIPIQLGLKEIYYISSYCGYAITLRSGLSDLLSFSDCKIMVVYPKELDYSIFKMRTGNPYEVVYKNKDKLIKDLENFME